MRLLPLLALIVAACSSEPAVNPAPLDAGLVDVAPDRSTAPDDGAPDAGALSLDVPAVRVCVPGAQVACACVGGAAGAQVCNSEGSALGTCMCPDAGTPDAGVIDASVTDADAMAADVSSDAPVARCVFGYECGATRDCVDGCCREPGDGGACEPPRASCVRDTECAASSVCYRGACRRLCPSPGGGVDGSCMVVDVQFDRCVMDPMGRSVCSSQSEQNPECMRSDDCTAGRTCVNARCR